MDSVLLSICVPAFNRPDWLQRALRSVAESSEDLQKNMEIVVSDDSTNPECRRVAEEVLDGWRGPKQYMHNDPPLGMAANWNHAIKLATGAFVLVLHDDDFLETSAIGICLEFLRQNADREAILFGVQVVDHQERIRKTQRTDEVEVLAPKQAVEALLSDSSFVRFPAMVLRRSAFNEVGFFNDRIGGVADVDMWLWIFEQTGLTRHPAILANYTVHPDALTMEMFNLEVVRQLQSLFERTKVLESGVLKRCEANFFHQFILAGTVRFVRRRKMKEAAQVFALFNEVELDRSLVRLKWRAIRLVLSAILIGQA